MIVPMKHLTLLCVKSEGDSTLEKLRELGCVHVDLSGAAGEAFMEVKGEGTVAETAAMIISKAAAECTGRGEGYVDAAAVIAADARRTESLQKAQSLRRSITAYEPFGDFDPALAAQLGAKGLKVSLLKAKAKTKVEVEGGYTQLLGSDGKTDYLAAVGGEVKEADGVEPVQMPAMRLGEMRRALADAEADAAAITFRLASSMPLVESIKASAPALADRLSFAAAREKLSSEGAVSWIEGWVPADKAAGLVEEAKARSWGVMMRDPAPGENPPTLIRPPKIFQPVVSLFKGLGVAPGYRESDVSVPFMCYFSVFFAMLVGDGGYGAIILALTLLGWKKAGKSPVARPWLILMTVFSSATVLWGVLSNTWFGANLPFAAKWPTVEWLADPSYHTMMFLCFTIGVSHLMLARIWNGVCKINSLTCLSEFAWAGILLCMYWITCGIVGIFQGPVSEEALAALTPQAATLASIPSKPGWFSPVFITSIVAVFLFTVPFKELKTRGAELGMLPLNIMSALGDIISYVRLFAVGLASVQVAVNFNNMALGLLSSENALWMNALLFLGTLAILLIGHVLNFAMAGLSVLVHAVRLNTLEFSNHKGVSWSGYDFSPFRKH